MLISCSINDTTVLYVLIVKLFEYLDNWLELLLISRIRLFHFKYVGSRQHCILVQKLLLNEEKW